ncbi:hypothetical protein P691DRAFT_754169 [Macrolepiota fuliginosa MF-IS2]|uniref:Uncharacterized protein n=1 Tax=Macrolepiota fuliginosa MF-IS2 TaxID=1400762 RepID=A0A9P5XR62_9AGAR|nr:hypothetical protein P691DRAFT_754169 [Macrolepiota fuliginosa MF-IS2]
MICRRLSLSSTAMLRSAHSPDTNDIHLRHLLDQRNARADPLGRYSTISEFSDTPSVYSRAFFSPRPGDKLQPDSPENDFPYNPPTFQQRPRRLLDDPSSSMLDLDEDSRSSMTVSEAYYDRDDEDSRSLEDDEGDEPLPRMSYLGPKMRVHSRAPWELEDETVQEVDETESTGHGSFIGMLTGGRGKSGQKTELMSPRPSNVSRPSVESSRSFLNPKRSFDTSHPRGALYALAQESLSTSSLGRPHHSGRSDGLRGKFSFGRLRSPSSNVDIPSSPDQSAIRLPSINPVPTTPTSPRASYDTTSSALDVQPLPGYNNTRSKERRGSLPFSDEDIHPYANPDLVILYTPTEPPPKSPLRATLHSGVHRNDSNITVSENPVLTSHPDSGTKSTLAPEMPTSASKRRVPHIQSKGISPPVTVHNPPDSPGHQQSDICQEPVPPLPTKANVIPGWTDRTINPGFSLISLEEARAQRTRTAPTYPPPSSDSTSSEETSATTSFHNATQDTATTLASTFSDLSHSHATNVSIATAARSRARSISTGAKAKNALHSFVAPRQPERRGSENGLVTGQATNKDAGGGKTLKHKKSGFMRLFGNGGKSNDRDIPPPPVPVLPEGHGPPIPRHNPKLSSHRIPVPSLSPSLLDAVAQHEGDSWSESGKLTLNPKRTPPPPLSINIGSSSPSASTFTDPPPRGSFLNASAFDRINSPQSAPPHISDFPTLKLRPVSTLFSAHFGEHIDPTKLNFDEVGPNETREQAVRRQGNERTRLDSFASGMSSGPSSASATSFADSHFNSSPIASSYASASGTALTTPTTAASLMSPIGPIATPWGRDRDYGASVGTGGRFSVDQHSAASSLNTNPNGTGLYVVRENSEATTAIKVLQEHLDNTNKMWQKRVWDLESQIRELKNEVADLKKIRNEGEKTFCETCGERSAEVGGAQSSQPQQRSMGHKSGGSVMSRPRARTGSSARFVNGQL